jgi:hypothetical protein
MLGLASSFRHSVGPKHGGHDYLANRSPRFLNRAVQATFARVSLIAVLLGLVIPAIPQHSPLSATPAEAQTTVDNKVIFISGVNTFSQCSPVVGGGSYVSNWVSAALDLKNNAGFETGDLAGASYGSSSYCPTPNALLGVLPSYASGDTCNSVAIAANRLNELFEARISQHPNAKITIVSHSLGGVVAGYWASRVATSSNLSHLTSIVAVDSPLVGINSNLSGAVADFLSATGDFACNHSSQVVQDVDSGSAYIAGVRSSASRIVVVQNTHDLAEFKLDQTEQNQSPWKQVVELTGQDSCQGDIDYSHSCALDMPRTLAIIRQQLASSTSPPPAPTLPPPPPPGSCTDWATFLSDVTIPDRTIMSPGQSFTKTWAMRNTGSCTWGAGYELVFVSGDRLGAASTIPMPRGVGPGEAVDLSVTMTTGSSPRRYTGYWKLRNPYSSYFGDIIWVMIDVQTSSGGGSGGTTPSGSSGGTTAHIVSFTASPGSPSSSNSVRLDARIALWPEFRSARILIDGASHDDPSPVNLGTVRQNSFTWDTSRVPRGPHSIVLEVSRTSDPNWVDPERSFIQYNLIDGSTPFSLPPDKPALREPYDWYAKDNSGAPAQVHLCTYETHDPDGPTIQYFFQILNQIGDPVSDSGWITSNCYDPMLPPGIYGWKARAGNYDGAVLSDWSDQTWHFSVAEGFTAIGGINFYQLNTNETHMCVSVTYGGVIAPEVYAWLNTAPDGSDTGDWRLLDHYGPNTTPDCTQSDLHGFWIRSPQYLSGTHAIRITAMKYDPDHHLVSSATATSSINIAYIRPSDFTAQAPSTLERNGTFWNNPAINFQWTRALRDDGGYELRVSTSQDIWNDPSPLLSVQVPAGTTQYQHTFGADYAKLFWSVRASNSAGFADFGNSLWFGIDRVLPACTVQPLAVTTPETVFQVVWAGTDNSAGVRSYDVQYQDSDRGSWTDWLSAPASKTYDLFTGQTGHTYFFRCRATDEGSNTGNYPVAGDTSIRIDPASRPQSPWWNTAYAQKRNLTVLNNATGPLPVGYPVKVRLDGSTTPSASDIFNASLASTKCDDVRVVYNDTTELDRFVASCSSSAIELWFRTRVTISGGGSDAIAHQIYYSNASANGPPADPSNVWYPSKESDTAALYFSRKGLDPRRSMPAAMAATAASIARSSGPTASLGRGSASTGPMRATAEPSRVRLFRSRASRSSSGTRPTRTTAAALPA